MESILYLEYDIDSHLKVASLYYTIILKNTALEPLLWEEGGVKRDVHKYDSTNNDKKPQQ